MTEPGVYTIHAKLRFFFICENDYVEASFRKLFCQVIVKIRFSLCIMKYHNMKSYEAVGMYLQEFLAPLSKMGRQPQPLDTLLGGKQALIIEQESIC